MCGLTGFARHPNNGADGLADAKILFEELLLAIKHRGTHATGFAATGGDECVLFKRAVPVDVMLKSNVFGQAMDKITEQHRVVQGHVRWATHNNAGDDDAAHPFECGKIVGAHNGIIRNWKEVEVKWRNEHRPENTPMWVNDSQAPFALLSTEKNPVKALDALDGYWALTWTKGKRLFMCRTSEAPLACAYVPSMKTLFWNSERNTLERILRSAKVAYESWEIAPNTIYCYDPAQFTAKGTNAVKMKAAFKGKQTYGRGKINTARPSAVWGDNKTPEAHSTRRTLTAGAGSKLRSWDTMWDAEPHQKAAAAAKKRLDSVASSATYTLKELYEKIDAMTDLLAETVGKVEVLEAEKEYLYKIVQKAGLLGDDDSPYDEEGDDEQLSFDNGETDALILQYQDRLRRGACTRCGETHNKKGNELVNTAHGLVRDDCLASDCAAGRRAAVRWRNRCDSARRGRAVLRWNERDT